MRLTKLVSALALAAAAVSAAGPAEASAGDRPFRGSATGVVTGATGPATLVVEYTGEMMHLGPFTRREEVTFHGDGSVSGTITFVADNADELVATFDDGHFTSANDIEGTYTFAGGTGRFDDATGTAAFKAHTEDFVHVSVTFDGTIDY